MGGFGLRARRLGSRLPDVLAEVVKVEQNLVGED
jgi:hypothetical protein